MSTKVIAYPHDGVTFYAHFNILNLERSPEDHEIPREPVSMASESAIKPADNIIPVGPLEKIGIIGAGVGGLYAAMMLQSLRIPFEILECTGRAGGRFFTHYFSGAENDYFVSDPGRFIRISRLIYFRMSELRVSPKHP